jgi:hypothetical protein
MGNRLAWASMGFYIQALWTQACSIVVSRVLSVTVTGRVCSDYSDRVYRMADRNYGGNGGCILTIAALVAAQ